MTPGIEEACRRPEAVTYLDHLAWLVGREAEPQELLPPWPAHGYFKRAYPIRETRLFISLHECDPAPEVL